MKVKARAVPDNGDVKGKPEPDKGDWLEVRSADVEDGVPQFDGHDTGQFDGYDKNKAKRDADLGHESHGLYPEEDGSAGGGGGTPPFTPVKRTVDESGTENKELDGGVSGGGGSDPPARFRAVRRTVDESGSDGWSGNGIVIGSKEKVKRGTEGEATYNGNWVENGAKGGEERDVTYPF